jgi:hypothetical protein
LFLPQYESALRAFLRVFKNWVRSTFCAATGTELSSSCGDRYSARQRKPTFRTLNWHAQNWAAPLIRSNEVKVNKNTFDSPSKSASTSWGVLKIGINGINPICGIDRT